MTDLYGCSDHNCIFGHKGGMGTNGGCSCEKELHRIGVVGRKAARQIRLLRTENERLRVLVEKRGLPIDVFNDCERLTAENEQLRKRLNGYDNYAMDERMTLTDQKESNHD